MLEGLFHEFVTDPTTRAWLQAANGFCNRHAWLAVRMRDTGSGLATIYETILEAIMKRFQKHQPVLAASGKTESFISKLLRNERSETARLLEQEQECQICVRAAEAENPYLNELLRWFDEDEMRAAFDSSFGLCLPHLDLLIARYPEHENLPILVEAEKDKCEMLLAELKGYLRKLDYRYSNEPRGNEQYSWRRVVELVAGKPTGILNRRVRVAGACGGTRAHQPGA